MTVKIGDKIPAVMLKRLTDKGMEDLSTEQVFKGKRIVLFGVPGAFTPTCSAKHLPGYVNHAADFKRQNIDEVICVAVNDPFVLKAWSEQNNAEEIVMLSDGNGTLTKALGLEMDGSHNGLGLRCKRFALVADDGIIESLHVEKPGVFDVSSAEFILNTLSLVS